MERSEIIRDMRLDVFDVLVGINLLREGLDIPEVCHPDQLPDSLLYRLRRDAVFLIVRVLDAAHESGCRRIEFRGRRRTAG